MRVRQTVVCVLSKFPHVRAEAAQKQSFCWSSVHYIRGGSDKTRFCLVSFSCGGAGVAKRDRSMRPSLGRFKRRQPVGLVPTGVRKTKGRGAGRFVVAHPSQITHCFESPHLRMYFVKQIVDFWLKIRQINMKRVWKTTGFRVLIPLK